MKKVALFFGLVSISILIIDFLKVQEICGTYNCRITADGVLQWTFLLSVICFIFSSITVYLKSEAFQKWWGFAKFGIPVVFGLSFLINSGFHHNPNGQWQDIFDIPALIVIYGVFIIVSFIQIWRGHKS